MPLQLIACAWRKWLQKTCVWGICPNKGLQTFLKWLKDLNLEWNVFIYIQGIIITSQGSCKAALWSIVSQQLELAYSAGILCSHYMGQYISVLGWNTALYLSSKILGYWPVTIGKTALCYQKLLLILLIGLLVRHLFMGLCT